MDHQLIKKMFLKNSTHYSGNLKDDEWHEMSFIKEYHYPERNEFYYVYKIVHFDLDKYESTGDICFTETVTYCSHLPKSFHKIPIEEEKEIEQ